MESLAHRLSGFTGLLDRRPTRDEFRGVNWDSNQAIGLTALWPMWSGGGTEIDLVSGYVARPTNCLTYNDPIMGPVYYGDNGGQPRGGGAPTTQRCYNVGGFSKTSSGSTVATGYPANMDPGSGLNITRNSSSFSMTAWVKLSSKDGYILNATDVTTANLPPNTYIASFASNAGSFPGWGFGINTNNLSNLFVEFDVDGGTNQATITGNIPLNDGNWHLIAAVYESVGNSNPTVSGGHMRIYVDGVLDTTEANGAVGGLGAELVPTIESWLDQSPWGTAIGSDTDFATAQWNGMFCDFRFYMRALTNTDLAAMVAPSTMWELYRPSSREWAFSNPGNGSATAVLTVTMGGLSISSSQQFSTPATGGIGMGALAPSSTGTFSVGSSGAVGLGPVSISDSTSFETDGSGSLGLGSLVITASPSASGGASGAITLVPLGVSSSGTLSTGSSGAVTLGSLVVADAITFTASGSSAITLGSIIVAGSAAFTDSGSGAISLLPLALSTANTFTASSSGAVTLGSLVIAANAGNGIFANGALTLGALTPSGVATFATSSAGSPTLGSLIAAGIGVAQTNATGTLLLSSLSPSGVGSLATTSSGSPTLLPLVVSSVAGAGLFGAGAITMQSLTPSGSGVLTSSSADGISLSAVLANGTATFATSASGSVGLLPIVPAISGRYQVSASATLGLGSLAANGFSVLTTPATANVLFGPLGVTSSGTLAMSALGNITLGSVIAFGLSDGGGAASSPLGATDPDEARFITIVTFDPSMYLTDPDAARMITP